MNEILIALATTLGFTLLLCVIALVYLKILKHFDKYIVKQIKEHGQILEINGSQKWYSDWDYLTHVSKFKFSHQDNKPITITRTGNISVKINDTHIYNLHELSIKFKDGYVLDYHTVYPDY